MHGTSNADKGNVNIYFKAIFLSLKGAEISLNENFQMWSLMNISNFLC